jgi:hypothetical protein
MKTEQEKFKHRYQPIIDAVFGNFEEKWWSSPNRAFSMRSPNDMLQGTADDIETLRRYILGMLNGDFS